MIRASIFGIVIIIVGAGGYFYLAGRRDMIEPKAVRVVPVQQGKFTASVPGRGKLVARKKEQLTSLISGVISDKGITVGQFLQKGKTIATIRLSDYELQRKRQEMEFANIDLEILDAQLQQSEELLKAKAISEREFKELQIRKYKQEKVVQNLRDDVSEKPLQTSLNGMLVEKLFQDGDRVGAGAGLATVVDTGSYAVEILVAQRQMPKVKLGQRVQYTSETFSGLRWGEVLEIGRVAGEKQPGQFGMGETEPEYTVLASIEKSQSDRFLIGANVEARFVLQEKDNALFIPVEAVLYRGDTSVVFLSSQGVAQKRIVELGMFNDRFIEIRGGLASGDTVVTIGNLDIEDGTPITTADRNLGNDQTKPRSRPSLFTR